MYHLTWDNTALGRVPSVILSSGMTWKSHTPLNDGDDLVTGVLVFPHKCRHIEVDIHRSDGQPEHADAVRAWHMGTVLSTNDGGTLNLFVPGDTLAERIRDAIERLLS